MLHEQIKNMLISYRKEKGLSRSEMAEILHVSESLIGMYERGERNISMDIANRICSLTGKEITISSVATSVEKEEKPIFFYHDDELMDAFPDWTHLGNDKGRGIYRMLKDFENANGKTITVEINEYGLNLYKINGEHKVITVEEYDELDAEDPTPYIDRYIDSIEGHLKAIRNKTLPFTKECNDKLMKDTKKFNRILFEYAQ